MDMSHRETYYLYLYEGEERAAMTTFLGTSDLDAARIGTAVFQACGDCCDKFEVRRDARYIAGMNRAALRKELTVHELNARTQASLVETEEHLLASRSRVATSRLLLERTQHVKRLVAFK